MKPYTPYDSVSPSIQLMLEDKCLNSNSGWTPSELYQSIIIQATTKSPEELAGAFNISESLAALIKNLGN
jgi:hypothetical protein